MAAAFILLEDYRKSIGVVIFNISAKKVPAAFYTHRTRRAQKMLSVRRLSWHKAFLIHIVLKYIIFLGFANVFF